MFAGAHTALVTPFLEDGTIDANSFRDLIDFSLENGMTGVVPTGTTGESPTLSYEEHNLVIELAVKHTKGRGLVIAGTGSNSTSEAITMTQHNALNQINRCDGSILSTPIAQQLTVPHHGNQSTTQSFSTFIIIQLQLLRELAQVSWTLPLGKMR